MSETDDINALAPHPRMAKGASVMYRAGQIRALFVALAAKNAEVEHECYRADALAAEVEKLRAVLRAARETILDLKNARWSEVEGTDEDYVADIDAALQSQEGEK